MMAYKDDVQNKKEFPFPFPPYEIQKEFMKNLYETLEKGKLGIFESPTGTGKSMSIICGALKWLLDHEEFEKSLLNSAITEIDEKMKKCSTTSTNWFSVQTEQIQLNTEKQALQTKLNNILKYEKQKNALKEAAEKENKAQEKNYNRMKKSIKSVKGTKSDDLPIENLNVKEEDIEEELLLEDVMAQSESSDDEDKDEEPYQNTKIFFCSRTHSQLTQFIGELKKSPYSDKISVISLASRQNYCINKSVKKLRHLNLINEHCLQLQKKKATVKKEKDIKRKKTATSCPFMPGNQDLLIGECIMHIQDVEEITKKGEDLKTCAYYASRKAVPHGQVILVPYNSILHKNTRISSGINLKDNILIIDEAHNLLDAIERMHSALITGRNLLHCYSQLTQYQKRFQSLFSAKSVLSLSQLSYCLKKLLTIFGVTTKSCPEDTIKKEISPKLYKLEEFEVTTEIDTVNMFELLNFIKNSKLIHKLQGFVEQYGNNVKIHEHNAKTSSGITEFLNSIKSNKSQAEESQVTTEVIKDEERSNNPLMAIVSFLECLKSSSGDGRICVIPGPTVGQSTIKYLLLNPAAHFHDIVKEARSVILAGGTMAPMSEFTDQLFIAAGAKPERIETFSCDHVIPQENISCNIVTRGPTGIELEFNYQNRQNTKLLDELGRILINLSNIVPSGIVVFLPSYNFEEMMYKHLDKTGLISKISAKKCIFREPKSTSQVNEVLEQYARRIKNPQSPQSGSLLFSVVGGKLSEGLNFSDDLGRCVVVVGMPYPNIKSAELQEKMKYLNENVSSDAGQTFYENSCMKAVNQCIGRAIRHINDYSTVVLLDKRYSQKKNALPHWIQRTLVIHNNYGGMISNIAKFFTRRKNLGSR